MVTNPDLENEESDEDIDCIRPRNLSKKTTEEILGKNLSSIIAIGKDGKPYLFLPYGTNESPDKCELCEEDAMTLLDITVMVPKS